MHCPLDPSNSGPASAGTPDATRHGVRLVRIVATLVPVILQGCFLSNGSEVGREPGETAAGACAPAHVPRSGCGNAADWWIRRACMIDCEGRTLDSHRAGYSSLRVYDLRPGERAAIVLWFDDVVQDGVAEFHPELLRGDGSDPTVELLAAPRRVDGEPCCPESPDHRLAIDVRWLDPPGVLITPREPLPVPTQLESIVDARLMGLDDLVSGFSSRWYAGGEP